MPTKPSSQVFQIENHKLVSLGFNTHLNTTPIIVIHGITASINSWTLGAPPILAQHPWYSLSLPGHYPAEFPPNFTTNELTPELIARLLSTAVSQLTNAQPAIIVGHSTGGFAALAVAAQHPELVAGVVCISGFVQGKWTSALGILQKLARNGRFGQALFNVNFSLMARSKSYYRQGIGLDAKDKQTVFNHPEFEAFITLNHLDVQKLSADAMSIWFQKMRQTDITDWLPRITAPALVMFGDSDPIVPPAQGETIASGLTHCQKIIFPGIGHLPTAECSDAYQKVLTAWLVNDETTTILG
jgi:pimeloyl-ACP methyl ester carboxylesterase